MVSNKNIGIGKIHYGEVYLYYPLKLLTSKNLKKIHQSLLANELIVTEETLDKFNKKSHELEKESIKNILENAKDFPDIEFSTNDNLELEYDNSNFKYFPEYSLHITESQDQSFIISINSLEVEEISRLYYEVCKNIENEEKIYGNIYSDSFGHYLIRPAKLQLNEKEIKWMNTYLYLFTNQTVIIKINFPLINCDADDMKKNNLDSYFKKIITYDGNEFDHCIEYINYLRNKLFSEYDHILDKQFYYINLLDFDGIPSNIKKLNDQLKKDLYLITCAPVPEINIENCLIEAQKHLNDYSFYISQGLDVFKTVGGCLHIESKKSIDYYLKKYDEEQIDRKDALHLISNSLCISSEFSINVILLKRIAITSAIYSLTKENIDIFIAKKEYNKNKLFINAIQGNCYGSVITQLKSYETMLGFYTQEELLNERLNIMNDSLKENEINRKEKINSLLSIITFFFTMMFGLPAIYESMSIIKQCFSNYDLIPYLSLEQLSLFIWFILMIFCTIKTKTYLYIRKS